MSSTVTNKLYDTNLGLVYAMRCIGKGQKAVGSFWAVMNLSSPPTRFERYDILPNSLKDVAEESMLRTSEECVTENDGSMYTVAAFENLRNQKNSSKNVNLCTYNFILFIHTKKSPKNKNKKIKKHI